MSRADDVRKPTVLVCPTAMALLEDELSEIAPLYRIRSLSCTVAYENT